MIRPSGEKREIVDRLRSETLAQVRSAYGPVPVHCEAYPCLFLPAVFARWNDGQRLCEWSDEYGGLAAQADLQTCDEAEMSILYSCGERTYIDQRTASFAVTMHLQPSRRSAPRVRCEGCGGLRDRIYWRRDSWACQSCQDLVMRRSLLSATQKLVLKRQRLTHEVFAPARPIRFDKVHNRKRMQLLHVRQTLGDDVPMSLGVPLRHTLTPFWFSQSDDRTEREQWTKAPAYLDLPRP